MITLRRPALLALPLLLTGCGLGPGTTATEDVPLTGDVRTVVLDVGSGDVGVRHDPAAGTPSLVRRVRYQGSDAPGATTAQDGDRLALNGCPGRCSVDYELVLPTAGAAVSGTLSSGGLELTGVGEVDVALSSGDARLREVTGRVAVELSSGEMEGDGLGGDTTVESSSGSVRLALARPASVRVRASSGDVTVAVPAGDYAVRAATDSGETRSTVTSTPGAAHTVDVETSSGDVTVESAG